MVKELGIYFVDCPQIAKTVEVYFQNLWTLSTLNSTIWTKVAWDKQWQAFRKVPCWSHFLHPEQRCRQYAQRSRVRKLQYIAELERKVQALQSEGIEVSAEMEFLTQQNIMLGMENKTLKQRLESLTQEQLIKRFQ